MRREEFPQDQTGSKLRLLLILMTGLLVFYVVSEYIFEDEEQSQCNPDIDENCEYETYIIVHFIGNYQQLLTNTNPFYYR